MCLILVTALQQQGLLCMSPPLGGMAVQASEKEAAARGQEEREK